MATSGTVTYNITAANLCLAALRIVNAYDPESSSTATSAQTTGALEALEMMLKSWETRGLQLWERKYGVIFLQKDQGVYVIGSPGPAGDHACVTTPLATGFIQTTIPAGAAAGAGTVTVESVTSDYDYVGTPAITMASADRIGIELANGSLFWTTINGAPAGNVITLATVIPASGVSAGAICYTYTTKLPKILRVLDCFIRQTGGNDVPVNVINREDYNVFGMKGASGTPNQIYHDPQRDSSNVYFYPVSNDISQLAFIEFQTPIQDVGSSSNNMDLPQEWIEAIKYNLALRLAPEYSVPSLKFKQIQFLAKETYDSVDGWDQEVGSLFLQPTPNNYQK